MKFPKIISVLALVTTLVLFADVHAGDSGYEFYQFESGHVRPLAMSTDGKFVYAVNTPDNRLEIFRAMRDRLMPLGSVAVGLEPVAVAVNGKDEVWVVNHLSDSISVVDVSRPGSPIVTETILVGDEPRDIVFAGTSKRRAFITTARRGQNSVVAAELTTPGIGRALVWVFDANSSDDRRMSRSPVTVVSLFTDTPRSLAVSSDNKYVYAAGFHSGNQTTVATSSVNPPITLPPPLTNFEGMPQPANGLIVKYDGEHWRDELNRNFDDVIMMDLPDHDVFVIDADARVPHQLAGDSGVYAGVGTIIYSMAVNPVSNEIYAMNTEALNEQRFEGPGAFAGHTVRGNHNQNRISILSDGNVAPRHLNKHIDYSTCCEPSPNAESILSVALPMQGEVTADGSTLYVPFMGSGKIGIYDTDELANDSFEPRLDRQVVLGGGGPTGLVLDESRNQLYVMTRFDNAIRVVNLSDNNEKSSVGLFNPESAAVVNGRRHLYDATRSSKGDSSCASCHVFGDVDSLSWDLGNPDASTLANFNPFTISTFNISPFPSDPDFAPLKGPMTTQSLRGMANHGPMHWRGDRTGAAEQASAQPDSGGFDERAAFLKFRGAFADLLGSDEELSVEEMNEFASFILPLYYPPNPIRNLDNSLTEEQALGRDIYFNRPIVTLDDGSTSACAGCHVLDSDGNAEFGVDIPGFFGSDGQSSLVVGQEFKVPHLRNIYTKVGKFGMPPFPPVFEEVPGLSGHQGDQIRGFGLSHAGDFDTVVRFMSNTGFTQNTLLGTYNPDGFPSGEEGLPLRRAVESFLFAFDTNLKPVVGQQITISRQNFRASRERRMLLVEQATGGSCDLVARLPLKQSQARQANLIGNGRNSITNNDLSRLSFVYRDGAFQPNSDRVSTLRPMQLWFLTYAFDVPLTLTCVPPGSGVRIGIDRDSDGVLDLDE